MDKYAAEMQSKYGVELVPDIATLLTKVDAVLLESVDGRPHLAQFREIVKGHKPVFIDKPLASTLSDAREIARVAREAGVPWFTSSSLRFSDGLAPLKLDGLNGVFVWAPGPLEPHHELDLSWYGIHGVEMLYTLMGTGCEQVSRISTPDADVITGRWKDGRLGVLRLMRPYSGVRRNGVFAQGHPLERQGSVYRLPRTGGTDHQVLRNGQAARRRTRNHGNVRIHGRRAAQRQSRRRARADPLTAPHGMLRTPVFARLCANRALE